jgi:hypothetical protein
LPLLKPARNRTRRMRLFNFKQQSVRGLIPRIMESEIEAIKYGVPRGDQLFPPHSYLFWKYALICIESMPSSKKNANGNDDDGRCSVLASSGLLPDYKKSKRQSVMITVFRLYLGPPVYVSSSHIGRQNDENIWCPRFFGYRKVGRTTIQWWRRC